MPTATLRPLVTVLAVVLTVTPAACGPGTPSSGPLARTISPQPHSATSNTPTAAPAPTTSAPAVTSPPTSRPLPGTGLRGQTVVMNCPADRADPPCSSTPVQARVAVLDRTGETTVATVNTDAEGRFAVALPPGSYKIRATRTNGSTARRPTSRQVTVSAGHFTTVTIRLITRLV
jgi:hypothetical protein